MAVRSEPLSVMAKLIGDPDDEGYVDLRDVGSLAKAIRNCLQHVERCLSHDSPRLEYLVKMKEGSAIFATKPKVRSSNRIPLANDTVRLFCSTVASLEGGNSPDLHVHESLDYEAFVSFRTLFSPSKKKRGTVQIDGVQLTSQFMATIDKIISTAIPSFGSVTGKLEELHLHNTRRFGVFPAISSKPTSCTFGEDLLQQVKDNIGRVVTVYGYKQPRLSSPFPASIRVSRIEPHPEDSDLPTFSSLRGIMADMEGESVSLIRKVRDDW